MAIEMLTPPNIPTRRDKNGVEIEPTEAEISAKLTPFRDKIARVIRVADRKFNYALSPDDFAMAWFMRKVRLAVQTSDTVKDDSGAPDITGIVCWITGTKWYDTEAVGTILFRLGDGDGVLLDFVKNACVMAGCKSLIYDTGLREQVDSKTLKHILYEVDLLG